MPPLLALDEMVLGVTPGEDLEGALLRFPVTPENNTFPGPRSLLRAAGG